MQRNENSNNSSVSVHMPENTLRPRDALAVYARAECRARDPREIGVARCDSVAERKLPIALSSERFAILECRGQLRSLPKTRNRADSSPTRRRLDEQVD